MMSKNKDRSIKSICNYTYIKSIVVYKAKEKETWKNEKYNNLSTE